MENLLEKDFTSFDGTRIHYQETGHGFPFILANGLGGTHEAWRHLIEYFKDRLHLFSWDYRGLYKSGTPSDLNRLDIADHCEDLKVLMDTRGIEKAILAGWSMGVQVIFEFYHRFPERVSAIIPICGTFGSPFQTAFDIKHSRWAIPIGVRALKPLARPIQKVIRSLVARPLLVPFLKATGVVGPTFDEKVFHSIAAEFMNLDFRVYFTILEKLGQHSAEAVLPDVRVPTLIVAADRDVMTPFHVSRHMKETIAGSEILKVPSGTHYSPIEFPELINLRIEKFLREKVLVECCRHADEPEPRRRSKTGAPRARAHEPGRSKERARSARRGSP